MKLVFACFFALIMTASAFAVDNYIDSTGTVVSRSIKTEVVVDSSVAAMTRGMVVCYDVTSDDGINVDLCGTAGFKAAGVIIDTSCAIGARCKLQTKGYFSNALFKYVATTNSVPGGVLYATTDGKAYAATAAAGLNPIGIALDASASADGVLEVVLDF